MDSYSGASLKQLKDLSQTIANQAQALADGNIPEGQMFAHVARLFNNADTLRAWAPDDRRD